MRNAKSGRSKMGGHNKNLKLKGENIMNELYYKLLKNLNYIVDVHGGGDRFNLSLINKDRNPKLYISIWATPSNEKNIIGKVTIAQKLFVEGKYMPELTELFKIGFKENDNFTAIMRKIKKIVKEKIGQ